MIRERKDHVALIDFAPFGSQWSEALAFEWSELDEMDAVDDEPEFRYLSKDIGIQPSKRNNYGIPKDVCDVYARGSAAATDDGRCTLDSLFERLRTEGESN